MKRPRSSDCDEASAGALQVALSKPAELIQKLSALQSSDPVQFKSVTGKVAQHFEQLASMAMGPESRGLAQLAMRFASAAQNGDLTPLMPPSQAAAPAPPAAPPAAPAPPAPVDAVATGFSLLDALTPSGAGDASDPLQRLSALKTSDPASFKRVVGQAAAQLEQLATLSDGADRDNLQSVAATFASSAQNGDLSSLAALRPPPPPEAPPPPPAAPPPPAPPAPVDALATAFSLVDGLAPAGAGGASDPLQRLSALKVSAPASFKNVMGQVATQLEQLATFSDGTDRDNLQGMALSFASSAQSGDLSSLAALQPPPPPAAPPPAAPPPPAPPAPVDALATAFSFVDGLAPAGAGDASDPLQRLSALKVSSPASFKQVMGQVATQLEQLANFSDGTDRDNLQGMALTFASSAQSGDLSSLAALQPPPPPAAPPPAAPPPPAPPAPIDALATAFSFVDGLAPAGAGDTSDPLQRLSALKVSNPASFKQVMGQVATQLEQLANFSQGADRDNLQGMALGFASGAQSGDLSGLAALQQASEAPPAAPDPAPAPPPAPAPDSWQCRQARDAYQRHAQVAQSFDDAFTSALALVDSLTGAAAA